MLVLMLMMCEVMSDKEVLHPASKFTDLANAGYGGIGVTG